MAEDDKKGPVKPPIIDAKPAEKSDVKPTPTSGAKSTSASPASKPSRSSASAKSSSAKPAEKPRATTQSKSSSSSRATSSTPKVEAKRGSSIGTIIIATLLGATLGAGTIGFMAFNNIAPFEKSATRSELSAAVETLQKRIFDLENAPAIDISRFALKREISAFATTDDVTKVSATQTDLNDQISVLTDQLSTLENSIADLSTGNTNSANLAELENLQAELAALKSSIIELSPDNSAALEQQLLQNERLEQAIAQISSIAQGQNVNVASIEVLKSEAASVTQSLAALSAKIDETSAIAPQSSAANLPLILSAWDSALQSGTPFASYLTSATAILPDLQPSEAMQSQAATGVSTLNALNDEFAQHIPLFVKDSADLPDDAAWYDKLAAQAKSAIGLRPLDQTGDDPLALVARIEAALGADKLLAAKSAFDQLPKDAQALVPEFGEKLNATFSAHQLMSKAQLMALKLATSPQGTNQ